MKARLYDTRVAHGRTERVQHGFAYRHVTWLIDLDDVPVAEEGEIIDAQEVKRHPPGMKAVAVNGKVVVEDGQCHDVFPGKVRLQQLCKAN